MGFMTQITRQMIPMNSQHPGHSSSPVYPVEGMHSFPLVPPNDSGDWRYREMQWLPAMPPYTLPGNSPMPAPQPMEVLVVWERFIEEKE